MRALAELLKWLLFAAKFIAGTLAVIFLLGEEAPDANLTLLQWLGVKGGAMLALYLLWRDYLLCGRLGLLPAALMDDWRELSKPGDGREEACDE